MTKLNQKLCPQNGGHIKILQKYRILFDFAFLPDFRLKRACVARLYKF